MWISGPDGFCVQAREHFRVSKGDVDDVVGFDTTIKSRTSILMDFRIYSD